MNKRNLDYFKATLFTEVINDARHNNDLNDLLQRTKWVIQYSGELNSETVLILFIKICSSIDRLKHLILLSEELNKNNVGEWGVDYQSCIKEFKSRITSARKFILKYKPMIYIEVRKWPDIYFCSTNPEFEKYLKSWCQTVSSNS